MFTQSELLVIEINRTYVYIYGKTEQPNQVLQRTASTFTFQTAMAAAHSYQYIISNDYVLFLNKICTFSRKNMDEN